MPARWRGYQRLVCVESDIGPFHHYLRSGGADNNNNNGVAVVQWAESNSLTLIHDAKLPKSFNSVRWKKGYNPDLIFASSSIDNMCVKSVLNPIPRTQHHPICVTINSVLVARPTAFRRRFNMRKANWSGYATNVDIFIEEVDPTPNNYERFVEAIRVTPEKHLHEANSPLVYLKNQSAYTRHTRSST